MAILDDNFKIDKSLGYADDRAVFMGTYYRITILSDVLIRFEYALDGKFNNNLTELVTNRHFKVPQMDVKQDKNYLEITTKYFKLQYAKEKKFASAANLKVSILNSDKVWYFNHPEARNFKGSSISLDDSTGKTKLYNGLYSTDGFATINDSNPLIMTEDGKLEKEVKNENIDLYLFAYRRDFGKCLQSYFELTGKPKLIPRYALGIWWHKDQDYNELSVDYLLNDFHKNEIPISVLLLKNNWHLPNNTFIFDQNKFKDPVTFINKLHNNKVYLGVNLNIERGITSSDTSYQNISKDLNITDNSVIPFNAFDTNFITSYLTNIVKPLNELGIDFYWLDYHTNINRQLLSSVNYYHYNYMTDTKRPMIFSRNSLIAAHRTPIHYSGETIVDWKTLKNLPYFNSLASNIGLSWWSHDIGGYKDGTEDSELYMRYCQLGTYSPIFRFSSKEGKFYKREPWKWDIKTYGIVKEYCQLRHRLIPYIYTEGYKYSKTGLPLIQPLYYGYPEIYDEPAYKNEYYFGSSFLVVPITDKKDLVMNRVVQRIFLPSGIWYDFNTGKKFIGNHRYVTFYKDEDYPVYVKNGSIIPLAVLDNNINNTEAPKTLEIDVFPGRSNTYNLYEDDGTTTAYQNDNYIVTQIDYNYLQNNYTLIIRPIEGKGGIIPLKRKYIVKFRNTKQATDIKVNSEETVLDYKSYVKGSDFIVEIDNVSTVKQLTINCKGKDIEIDAVRIINEDIESILNDIQIPTKFKEKISDIIFSDLPVKQKRIAIKKLRREGLGDLFVRMFIKLLEYLAQI